MTRRYVEPPRAATWLLEAFVPAGPSRDGLLGDMEERFQTATAGGLARARAWYWGEAIASIARYGTEAVRRRISDHGGGGMEQWWKDVRLAARGASRHPGFTATVVATLALGIGANAAVFSVLRAVLLDPLPYQNPGRLVMVDQLQAQGFRAAVSMPNYEDWKQRSTAFDRFAMEKPEAFRIDGDLGAEVVEGRFVLGEFFETFGVDPLLGTLPSAADLGPGAERIVVLTYGQWQSRFGADVEAIGRSLRIRGAAFEVVAVLPRDFALDREVAFYVPMGLLADDPVWQDRTTSYGGWVVGRLRPGVGVSEARADLERVTDELRATHGDQVAAAALLPMRDWYVGDVRRPLVVLMAGVALVLLVASANVASLLIGRAEERRGELALRAALGASRAQVLRQLLVETLFLGLVGGLFGLLLAGVGLRFLTEAVGASLPPAFAERVSIDASVVLVALSAALLVTLAFGLAPALGASRRALGHFNRAVGSGREGARMRGLLVAGEVALSVVLLVCTGLLVRSVSNLRTIDAGFATDGVLTQRLSAPGDRYPDRNATLQVQEQIRQEVARLPGVSDAALSNLFPLSRTNWEMLFREPSRWPAETAPSVLYTAATTEYFDVFSIPLRRGRLFTEEDREDSEPVVLIDETAAALFWPGEDPIGKTVAVDDVPEGDDFVPLWRTIIGVVGHVRNYELTEPSRIEAYVPLTQSPACCRTLWLTVRTAGDAAALAPTVRDVVRRIDPEMPVFRVGTMRSVVEGETVVHRAVRELFIVFGGLALLLGGVGIYGVVAAGAARRTREVALRMALGSTPAQAAGTVVKAGLRWVGVGLVAGILGAILAGRAIESLLVEVPPFDPLVMVVACGALGLCALVAVWVPARRVARVEPGDALRND